MATVCSCLKYFGKVFIGVARDEDKEIILRLVSCMTNREYSHILNLYRNIYRLTIPIQSFLIMLM